jgi:hypothetical protein
VSIDEAVEHVRAMIADRNTSDVERAALVLLLRVALRGQPLSTSQPSARSAASQSFARVREVLAEARKSDPSGGED